MKVLAIIFAVVLSAEARKLVPLKRIIKDPRILGGTPAAAGEFPWMCAIYKTSPNGTFFGAGSLVKADWVMTAAQLVWDASSIELRFGSLLVEGDDPNRVTVTATRWTLYDDWNPATLLRDIALVHLDSPMNTNQYIQPIPIGTFGCCYIYPGNTVTAIGWGQTSDTGEISNQLMKTSVDFIDQHVCEGYYGSALSGDMVCAVATTGNSGICYGDIGGPLIAPVNYWVGTYDVALAISSWMSANGCESSDPNGFTRADAFYDWIYDTIGRD